MFCAFLEFFLDEGIVCAFVGFPIPTFEKASSLCVFEISSRALLLSLRGDVSFFFVDELGFLLEGSSDGKEK